MDDVASLKMRYEQDEPAVQIGGLASSLSRIAWLARRGAARDRAGRIFRESKYFAEWAAARCPVETQSALSELQRQLVVWERRWEPASTGQGIAQEIDRWVEKLLAVSGLLNSPTNEQSH